MRRTLFLALAVSSISLAACSDKNDTPPATDGGTKAPPAWRAAVGAGGTFSQTFDEIGWRTRSLGDVTLFGVACVGNLDGWAVGARGTIGHTIDGGATWTFQSSGTTRDLHGVRFGDPMHGLAVGDAGTLLTTNDAGAHWSNSTLDFKGDLRSATIAWGAGVWLAVGGDGVVLRSIDGGASWSSATIDGASALTGAAIDVGAHVAIVVDDAGSIFTSTDGARTFVREANVGAPLSSVSMEDDGTPAIAVGAHGTVMLRDDASRTWSSIAAPFDGTLHAALVTANGTRLYVAGDSGAMFTRGLQGDWTRVPVGTTATLFGMEDL